MYAFIDLKTRMFIQREPDEPDAEKQRASLERQLPRFAKLHPNAVVSIIHTDDQTHDADWVSTLIVGLQGSAAEIDPGTQASEHTEDKSKTVMELLNMVPLQMQQIQNAHKAKMAEFHRSITMQASAMQAEFDKSIAAFHRKLLADVAAALKPGKTKAKPTIVTQAGYDRTGAWLAVGTIIKPKKPG